MDPIGATGNLFFKGFFLVMLGLHLRTTGDERWNAPFDIVRDGENTFTWFHTAIADHLHEQWTNAPDGCHCENTKIWPYCLAGAGLGLQLHDLLRGTDHHAVFDDWWRDVCRSKYLHLDGDELPQSGDPLLRPDPRRAPRGAGDVRHGARALPRAAGARRRPPALRGGHAPVRDVGAGRSGRAARAARVGDRVVAGEGVGARPLGRRARRDGRTSTTSPRGTASAASSRGASSSHEPHPRGQYNGTMAAAQVATEQAWYAARQRSGPARGSPIRRWSTSTSRPSRSPRRGGTPSARRCSSRPSRMNERGGRRAHDVPRREPAGSRPASTVELEGGGAVEAVRRRGRARGAHDFAPAPAPDRAARVNRSR